MLATDVVVFLCLVSIGAMVQSITGFAMGLIIMGGVTAIGVADIAFAAAVVSLISLANTMVALRHTYKFIDKAIWHKLIISLVPATVVGVVLLNLLSGEYYEWLRTLLGVVIIAAGSLLMAQPHPWATQSGPAAFLSVGFAGGVIGGMYGAGGAPLAWLLYRQPLEVNVVRATLLATFLVSTSGRTIVVAVSGDLGPDVLLMALVSMPLVVAVTVISTKYSHRIPDKLVRRFVFALLIILGASLIVW